MKIRSKNKKEKQYDQLERKRKRRDGKGWADLGLGKQSMRRIQI
jgi:hypothetical protein